MILLRRFILLILLCLPASAYSSIALFKHTQAVSQTMSALYMQGLSEGNKKYEKDLESYKKKANSTLKAYYNEDPVQAEKLNASWGKLKDLVIISYSSDYGWDIDAEVRRDLRTYQTDLYQLSLTKKTKPLSEEEKYQFALLQIESIIARFFDIASVYNGALSLSNTESQRLDPATMSQEFKLSLDNFASSSNDDTLAKKLISAKNKWEFIEEGVVNYSDQSAYFLVYATKKKVNEVIESGISQLP
jgi:hypothetical protein